MKLPKITNEQDFDSYFQDEIWLVAAKQICLENKIAFREIRRGNSSDHIVFLIDNTFVLKIFRPFRRCFEREKKALEFIEGKISLNIPKILHIGEIENFQYFIIEQISGELMSREMWLTLEEKTQIKFITKIAQGVKEIHELNSESFTDDWAEFVKDRAETFIERQISHGVNQQIIKALPVFIDENLKLVSLAPTNFMHSDVHFGNLRVLKTNGNLEISGLFDFADSRRGFYEYEFLAIGLLIMQGQKNVQREFFKAYGYAEKDLDETMRKRLMMLTMLYETSNLRRYAMRLRPEAVEYSLEKLEREIWSF